MFHKTYSGWGGLIRKKIGPLTRERKYTQSRGDKNHGKHNKQEITNFLKLTHLPFWQPIKGRNVKD